MNLLALHFLLLLSHSLVHAETEEIVAEAGDEVLLSCPVKTSECGAYHSLKWYRDTSRVFVYSPIAGFRNAEDILMDRCLDPAQAELGAECPRGILEPGDEDVGLTILPIEMEDGGEYRCEITYLDVSSDCPVVHFTNLRTIAPPDYQLLSLTEAGEDMADQVVGPYAADSEATFVCESGGGRPAPSVTWVFGDEEVDGEHVEEEVDEEDGVITSTLTIQLEREHSGASLQCRVSHEALDEDLVTQLQVDVNIAVASVELEPESLEADEGEEMEVVCRAHKSRPAATITWTLPEHVEYSEEQVEELLDDDTYDTVGRIRFLASSEDDGMSVSCQAVNEVMEEPLKATEDVTVFFAPRVSLAEDEQTTTAGAEFSLDCMVEANPANLSRVAWYRDSDLLEGDRFVLESTVLVILEVERRDMGIYFCEAENRVGQGRAEQGTLLQVYYPPSMEVTISPEDAVTEGEDVELQCHLMEANPEKLISVTWFKNGEVYRKDPDPELCKESSGSGLSEEEPTNSSTDEGSGDECHVDGILLLENVGRGEAANYSCAATNSAGMGDAAEGVSLDIHYLPGLPIIADDVAAVKGGDVQLVCEIEDPGNPEATSFIWKKSEKELEEVSSNLTLAGLELEHEGNYSCAGVNFLGVGQEDVFTLEVAAPPQFLISLAEDTTFVVGREDASMQCQVECSPLCTIEWIVGEEIVTEEDEQFKVEEQDIKEDNEKNQFTSVISMLTWLEMDRTEENFTVECRVIVGDQEETNLQIEISSLTTVTVHYLPGTAELVVEDPAALVKGGEVLLTCNLDDAGKPEAQHFLWTKDGEKLDESSKNLTLTSLELEQNGNYSCAAENHLGAGEEDFVHLGIEALPEFLVSLPDDTTFVLDDGEASLQCQVECSPMCKIEWFVGEEQVGGEVEGSGEDAEYRVEEEEVEEDREKNQFSSVLSTLTFLQLDQTFENVTVSCRVQAGDSEGSGLEELEAPEMEDGFFPENSDTNVFRSILSLTTVNVEYGPADVSVSSGLLLEVEEGDSLDPLVCGGAANPSPDISWLLEGKEMAKGGILNFPEAITRTATGDYVCLVSNMHGEERVTVAVSVLYPPTCDVSYSLEGEHVVLACMVEANPKEVTFMWTGKEELLPGQVESTISLGLGNDNAGMYYCHVNNTLGEGSCHLELTAEMMIGGLTENEVKLIIIILAVAGVILLICLACYYCHRRHTQGNKAITATKKPTKDIEKGKGAGSQPSADKSFYENLPFHGLKSPPKQVLNPKTDDHLDYADADYKELYSEGPVSYKAASKQQKNGKKL